MITLDKNSFRYYLIKENRSSRRIEVYITIAHEFLMEMRTVKQIQKKHIDEFIFKTGKRGNWNPSTYATSLQYYFEYMNSRTFKI